MSRKYMLKPGVEVEIEENIPIPKPDRYNTVWERLFDEMEEMDSVLLNKNQADVLRQKKFDSKYNLIFRKSSDKLYRAWKVKKPKGTLLKKSTI